MCIWEGFWFETLSITVGKNQGEGTGRRLVEIWDSLEGSFQGKKLRDLWERSLRGDSIIH